MTATYRDRPCACLSPGRRLRRTSQQPGNSPSRAPLCLGDVQGRNKGSRKVARSRYCPAVNRKAAPQPAEARAEAVGHDGNDQQRGRGMVTNAGSRPTANADRSHTRVTSEGTSQRLPDIANSGLPPESRPGTVRLIRHTWKGRETSGREGNIRRNQLEAEHRSWPSAAGPGAAGCTSAPRARKHRSVSSGPVVPQTQGERPSMPYRIHNLDRLLLPVHSHPANGAISWLRKYRPSTSTTSTAARPQAPSGSASTAWATKST
jgi:hypothetical protein